VTEPLLATHAQIDALYADLRRARDNAAAAWEIVEMQRRALETIRACAVLGLARDELDSSLRRIRDLAAPEIER
jgi:hypothetical protein